MTPDSAWSRLISQPVAVLATIDPDGSPHQVPFTFSALGERRLVSAVDQKPKATRSLRRLDNIHRDPRVTVLAHHYADDWDELWWVRASGVASIEESEPRGARDVLVDRYPPYARHSLGPWIVIEVERLVGWSAAD